MKVSNTNILIFSAENLNWIWGHFGHKCVVVQLYGTHTCRGVLMQVCIMIVNNFSSVYRIFTKLGHMIPLWKGKNPIYFGVIRSKVKVTITINRIFDNMVVSVR